MSRHAFPEKLQTKQTTARRLCRILASILDQRNWKASRVASVVAPLEKAHSIDQNAGKTFQLDHILNPSSGDYKDSLLQKLNLLDLEENDDSRNQRSEPLFSTEYADANKSSSSMIQKYDIINHIPENVQLDMKSKHYMQNVQQVEGQGRMSEEIKGQGRSEHGRKLGGAAYMRSNTGGLETFVCFNSSQKHEDDEEGFGSESKQLRGTFKGSSGSFAEPQPAQPYGSQMNLLKNNLFAFSNESQFARIFCEQEPKPGGSFAGIHKPAQKVHSFAIDVVPPQYDQSLTVSPPEIMLNQKLQRPFENLRPEDSPADISGQNLLQVVMPPPRKRSKTEDGSSSDSFSSLNCDIQKMIQDDGEQYRVPHPEAKAKNQLHERYLTSQTHENIKEPEEIKYFQEYQIYQPAQSLPGSLANQYIQGVESELQAEGERGTFTQKQGQSFAASFTPGCSRCSTNTAEHTQQHRFNLQSQNEQSEQIQGSFPQSTYSMNFLLTSPQKLQYQQQDFMQPQTLSYNQQSPLNKQLMQGESYGNPANLSYQTSNAQHSNLSPNSLYPESSILAQPMQTQQNQNLYYHNQSQPLQDYYSSLFVPTGSTLQQSMSLSPESQRLQQMMLGGVGISQALANETSRNSFSTNSSHNSSTSKTKLSSSLSLINQVYKNIQDEEDKLQFLIQNSYVLSKDQSGCRRLQKKIDEQMEKGNTRFCEDMLNVLLENFGELMNDSFANYLCQKLIKLAKDYQIDLILQNIQSSFVSVANNKHGTRALQNLLNFILPLNESRSFIISESFKDSVIELALNIHGNHVIQICLDHLYKEEHKQFIYKTVITNCSKIATDKHGCCVIQKLLNSTNLSIQGSLVKETLCQLGSLINDQYGNYVVQQILKYNNKDINYSVASFICSNFRYFCTQKISSNVVESAIRNTPIECQKQFFSFLTANRTVFRDIMFDQFGNYVIQAIFQKSSELQDQTYFEDFFCIFMENQEQLSKISFGKKFIQKISAMGTPELLNQQYNQESGSKLKRLAHVKKNALVQKPVKQQRPKEKSSLFFFNKLAK